MGQRYRKMGQKSGPGLACCLDFTKRKELESKFKKFSKSD